MPLVSILIPCFNAEAFIGDAIESALSQTHGDVEVIVVDDGSTDDSLAVIERFADRPHFRYETGPNRGGNVARNRLLALASGRFVQFLDADDTLHPGKIATCLEAMAPGVDMVYTDYLECHDGRQRHVRLAPPGSDLIEHFIRHNVQTSLPLHRTAALRAGSGFDETLRCCQEYEFHARLARDAWNQVTHVATPLCSLRKVAGSVSSNDVRVYETLATVVANIHAVLCSRGEVTPARADAIAMQLLTCSRHLARHGHDAQARSAYRLARTISAATSGPYRIGMRSLVRLFGPVWAERLRMSLTHRRRSQA